MKKSAGLIVIWNKKILLVHPCKSPLVKSYSIPKGGIESGEKTINTAIRETFEETGVKIKLSQIKKSGPTIDYTNDKGKIYKKVYTFIVFLKSLDEIGLVEEVIKKENIQLKEIDWAGFVGIEELGEKLFPRFSKIIDIINESE